jgi:hypothetical protein
LVTVKVLSGFGKIRKFRNFQGKRRGGPFHAQKYSNSEGACRISHFFHNFPDGHFGAADFYPLKKEMAQKKCEMGNGLVKFEYFWA